MGKNQTIPKRIHIHDNCKCTVIKNVMGHLLNKGKKNTSYQNSEIEAKDDKYELKVKAMYTWIVTEVIQKL